MQNLIYRIKRRWRSITHKVDYCEKCKCYIIAKDKSILSLHFYLCQVCPEMGYPTISDMPFIEKVRI